MSRNKNKKVKIICCSKRDLKENLEERDKLWYLKNRGSIHQLHHEVNGRAASIMCAHMINTCRNLHRSWPQFPCIQVAQERHESLTANLALRHKLAHHIPWTPLRARVAREKLAEKGAPRGENAAVDADRGAVGRDDIGVAAVKLLVD